MSQPAPEAPAAPAAGKRENVFTHKIGPLPMWAWVAIVGGALVAWRLYASKNAATQAQQQGTSTSSTDTSANTVPQFVNQTYVTTTAPASPGTDGGTPPPVNPSPTGSGTQPKPTTTTGQWHYPAPTGLATYDLSDSGVRLKWNAVTGPSGQHPNSYTVATYDTKNKLVDQFDTKAGNTSTAEYGKGGKGLPRGTYHTQVWANGGPVAPPHATVQYTIVRGAGLKA